MLGADIYDRWQDVTDWAVLARQVDWVWIKGTDGGGRASVRADGFVRGAREAGIPVGLYHYAQLAPRPEVQADVLAAEVRRLGALDVAPALDIEDPFHPGPTACGFAQTFLRRLRAHFPKVAIYGNSTMLAAIRPDLWDIDGLVIWCADYGPNDGRRHPDLRPYTGRVDVHQYTSRGRLAGIPGDVDLNHALTTRHLLAEEDDVALSDDDIERIKTAILTANVTNVNDRKADRIGPWLQDALRWIDVRTFGMDRTLTRILLEQREMRGELSDDEAKILAALQADSDGLTPEEQAAIIRDQLDGSVLRALRSLLTDDQEPEEAPA